nr:MAG TPA: hypothetical protein [Caudoviricetes sp.]
MVNAQGFVLPCAIIIPHSDRFVKRKSHKKFDRVRSLCYYILAVKNRR